MDDDLSRRQARRRARPAAANRLECGLLVAGLVTRILDREKIEALLRRRFPGAAAGQIAAAVNAIVGLDEEWEEVPVGDWAGERPVPCLGSCYLWERARAGARFRVFKWLGDESPAADGPDPG